MGKSIIRIAVWVVLLAALAGAQEKFGVTVYPGAKEVPSAEKTLASTFHTTAGCYRTSDSMAKVAAFYKQQQGMKLASQTQILFEFTGKGVKVTINSPWVDPTDYSTKNDTLITIERR
jgi:translation elongation factor EF-G